MIVLRVHGLKNVLQISSLRGTLRSSGTAHLKEVKSLHDKMVRDSGMKARFAQIYRQYALLVKGQAAPLFCLPDINGVEKKTHRL